MQFLVLFYDMSALVVPVRSSVLFVNHLNKRKYKIRKGFPRLYIPCTCSGLLLPALSQFGEVLLGFIACQFLDILPLSR